MKTLDVFSIRDSLADLSLPGHLLSDTPVAEVSRRSMETGLGGNIEKDTAASRPPGHRANRNDTPLFTINSTARPASTSSTGKVCSAISM